MTTLLRDRDLAERWVCAGLVLQRGVELSPREVTRAAPWIESAATELAFIPPVTVIADIGRLLTRGPFDAVRSAQVGPRSLVQALRSYEDHLLGRLAADYRLDSARAALARVDPSMAPDAVAILISQLLGRLPGIEFSAAGPAVVRHTIHQPPAELIERGFEALRDDEEVAELLRQGFEALSTAARHSASLLGDAEIFTLENHAALRGAADRMALGQAADAGQALERALPHRVKRSSSRVGFTPTRVEDESAYPIGGYSSLSTSGGMENLVSSELIYMDAGNAIDLFDVRWASGELLKYTRDESVFTRQRRTIVFVLAPDLDDCRLKDPDLPWQRLVMVLALIIAGVRRLTRWLDEAELRIEVRVCEAENGSRPLAPEMELLRLLLREWIEANVVGVQAAGPEHAVVEELMALTQRSHTHMIRIASRQRDESLPGDGSLRWVELLVGDDPPRLVWDDARASAPLPHGWQGWLRACLQLMRGLV